jgi:hypothetical protein
MTITQKKVMCKSCTKVIATILATGLVPDPSASDIEGCDTCGQFLPLYNAMKAADEDYASFKDRRDNYRPKQDALAALRKSHIDFDNWLMNVEKICDELQHVPSNIYLESVNEPPHGVKRSHSLSQSPAKTGRSQISPSTGRYSTGSLLGHKRLKFSDSVEFRDDYRPCQFYSRNDAAYVRGRYAPPEGSTHLDTSGSDKTFLKFTGMKKVGKDWVDVWKVKTDDDSKDIKAKVADANTVRVSEIKTKTAPSYCEEDATEAEGASSDARGQRLARRRSITIEAEYSRRNIVEKPKTGRPKSDQLFRSSVVPRVVPKTVDTLDELNTKFTAIESEVVNTTVQGGTREEISTPSRAENMFLGEEGQPQMIFSEEVVREQGVERMETSTAWTNQKPVRHDYSSEQYFGAKSQSTSTEEAQHQVEEKHNHQQELDSGDEAATSEGPRKASEESRREHDLAVRIFSIPTTTDKQEPSTNYNNYENATVEQEQERVDKPLHEGAEVTARDTTLNRQSLDHTIKSTSPPAHAKAARIEGNQSRDSYATAKL